MSVCESTLSPECANVPATGWIGSSNCNVVRRELERIALTPGGKNERLDNAGNNVLHLAAALDAVNVFRVILESPVLRVCAQQWASERTYGDKGGHTPMHVAVLAGARRVLELMYSNAVLCSPHVLTLQDNAGNTTGDLARTMWPNDMELRRWAYDAHAQPQR